MIDLKTLVNGITLTKACKVKADKDSKESKLVNLRITFNNVTLGDVFNKAVSSAVIQWQNGPGRKHFASWKTGQVVEVAFSAPGASATIDPIAYVLAAAAAAGMNPEAWLKAEALKRQPKPPEPDIENKDEDEDEDIDEDDEE